MAAHSGRALNDGNEIGRYGWLFALQDLHHRRGPGDTCLAALRGDHPWGEVWGVQNHSRVEAGSCGRHPLRRLHEARVGARGAPELWCVQHRAGRVGDAEVFAADGKPDSAAAKAWSRLRIAASSWNGSTFGTVTVERTFTLAPRQAG